MSGTNISNSQPNGVMLPPAKAEWQVLYGAKVLCTMCCVQVARRRYDNAMESESVLSSRKLRSAWDVQCAVLLEIGTLGVGGVAVGVSQSPNSSPKKKECAYRSK